MRFEYADGRMPLAMTKDGVTYYLTYDQVGSLRVVADASGNMIKRIDYDSFGNIINDSDPGFEIPFGFAGGLHDRDTGLVRFGFRDYDPDIGRWTAKDPILFFDDDTDLYGYCLNDPINLVDPDGLQFKFPRWWPWLSAARAACSLYCFARAIHCHIGCYREASADPCQNGGNSRSKKCSECVKDYMKCMDICNPSWRDKIKIPRLPAGPGSGGGGAGRVFWTFQIESENIPMGYCFPTR